MGFRDLEGFNKALLAKQGWLIIQNPSSLVGRVLKSKYFPSFSFMDSKVGNNPSFIWRCIWQGKKIIDLGLIWRACDGRDISVFKDKWIPRTISFWIVSLEPPNAP